MPETEQASYVFTVKEDAKGTPSIMLEPRDGSLSCLGDGFLVLNLRPGTNIRKAQEIANVLNDGVAKISHVRFGPSDYSR